MKFTHLSKRILIILSAAVIVIAAAITVGILINNGKNTEKADTSHQENSSSIETSAYKKIDEGKYNEAIPLFKQALQLSQAESRSQDDIENIKNQINFAEQEIEKRAQDEASLTVDESQYEITKGEDGVEFITPKDPR